MVEDTNLREGYKRTEMGIIPEDWDLKTIKNFGRAYGGLTGKNKSDFENGNKPYITFLNIMYNTTIDMKDFGYVKIRTHENQNRVENGDLFFNTSSETPEEVGMCSAINGEIDELYLNSFCFGFRLFNKSEYIPLYLSYYFRSNNGRMLFYALAQGATRYNLSKKAFYKMKIIHPSIKEQKAIATALSDIDNLLVSLEKLIDKKKKIKEGTMQELLTGKKRLPGFTGEWEEKKLGEIVRFNNGKAHENVISDNGKFIVVNSKFISTEGRVVKYSNKDFCPALKEDILMVMSDIPNGRAISKCYYVQNDYKYTVNQRICALRSNGIVPKFLFNIIDRNPYYLSFDDGVKQTNLRKEDVLNCELKIPSEFKEQKAIANILSDMDSEIEVLEQKLNKYKEVKQGMMQELLTGRIRLI